MRFKNIIILILLVDLFIGIASTGYYVLMSQFKQNSYIKSAADKSFGWKFPVAKLPLTGSTTKQIAYSDIRDPGGIPQGLPVRLKIPAISVDSAIEDALITPDGRMDVPAGSVNVAWFSLGPHPGQVGSAVIGGHFGISNGVPWVFYNLDKVKIGQKVYIVDDNDKILTFIVRKIESFDRNADSTTVFTSSDGIAHLNLITCEGTWNQVNGTYPQRLVVFTDAIPTEKAPTINKPIINIITPTLTPTEAPTPTETSQPDQPKINRTFINSINNLYATPIDGLITTLLLITILFIALKIIRR